MKHLIWLILIFLIILRYYQTKPVYHSGDTVRITSTIYSDPINYPDSIYLRLAGLKVYLPVSSQVVYGDGVVVEGVVNGDKLDSPKLIKVIKSTNYLANFRNKIVDFFLSTLPQPESGLIAGVVIGSKGALTQDFYDQTKVTGVAHVVVASGTNITFVVSFLMGALTLIFPRRKAILFVVLGIVLYLFVSGFEAPLIRAAIMSTFLFLGQEKGMVTSTWRVFFLTGILMLIIKPIWVADIGFILSFVSTASLMLFERKIRSRLNFLPEIVKEGFSTSLAAQIGVAPILFVTFGQFNILSPIINALVLWTVPFIMIFGTLGGVVGIAFPLLGSFLLYLVYPFSWWFVSVVSFFN